LAEVLITLAIIGIIAAITIPSIIANHQKTALEAQFAKTYRTLSQVVSLAIAEHGDIGSWDWKDPISHMERDEFSKKYILPYLNATKFCAAGSDLAQCNWDNNYKNINDTNFLITPNHPMAILGDGSQVIFIFTNGFSSSNTDSLSIYVDINGSKKPNTKGLDLHYFQFFPKTGEFFPAGINNRNQYSEETNSYKKITRTELLRDCGGGGNGGHCGALIIQDGFKMNY